MMLLVGRCKNARCVCSDSASASVHGSEAGSRVLRSAMLAIRARVCVCVCEQCRRGELGFNAGTRSPMLVFVRGSRVPGRDWRKREWW